MIIQALFYIFATLLCVSAIQTITIKNPVHAALFLILTFVSASALFILQGAEFLGLVLILVYVGAVMVLFLFVVMMLDTKVLQDLKQNYLTYLPTAIIVGVLFIAQIGFIIYKAMLGRNLPIHNNGVDTSGISNTKALGKLIFTEYLVAFEVVGCILLVGIIIAVVLTLRSRKDTKSLDVAEQISVNAKDRLILVDSKVKE